VTDGPEGGGGSFEGESRWRVLDGAPRYPLRPDVPVGPRPPARLDDLRRELDELYREPVLGGDRAGAAPGIRSPWAMAEPPSEAGPPSSSGREPRWRRPVDPLSRRAAPGGAAGGAGGRGEGPPPGPPPPPDGGAGSGEGDPTDPDGEKAALRDALRERIDQARARRADAKTDKREARARQDAEDDRIRAERAEERRERREERAAEREEERLAEIERQEAIAADRRLTVQIAADYPELGGLNPRTDRELAEALRAMRAKFQNNTRGTRPGDNPEGLRRAMLGLAAIADRRELALLPEGTTADDLDDTSRRYHGEADDMEEAADQWGEIFKEQIGGLKYRSSQIKEFLGLEPPEPVEAEGSTGAIVDMSETAIRMVLRDLCEQGVLVDNLPTATIKGASDMVEPMDVQMARQDAKGANWAQKLIARAGAQVQTNSSERAYDSDKRWVEVDVYQVKELRPDLIVRPGSPQPGSDTAVIVRRRRVTSKRQPGLINKTPGWLPEKENKWQMDVMGVVRTEDKKPAFVRDRRGRMVPSEDMLEILGSSTFMKTRVDTTKRELAPKLPDPPRTQSPTLGEGSAVVEGRWPHGNPDGGGPFRPESLGSRPDHPATAEEAQVRRNQVYDQGVLDAALLDEARRLGPPEDGHGGHGGGHGAGHGGDHGGGAHHPPGHGPHPSAMVRPFEPGHSAGLPTWPGRADLAPRPSFPIGPGAGDRLPPLGLGPDRPIVPVRPRPEASRLDLDWDDLDEPPYLPHAMAEPPVPNGPPLPRQFLQVRRPPEAPPAVPLPNEASPGAPGQVEMEAGETETVRSAAGATSDLPERSELKEAPLNRGLEVRGPRSSREHSQTIKAHRRKLAASIRQVRSAEAAGREATRKAKLQGAEATAASAEAASVSVLPREYSIGEQPHYLPNPTTGGYELQAPAYGREGASDFTMLVHRIQKEQEAGFDLAQGSEQLTLTQAKKLLRAAETTEEVRVITQEIYRRDKQLEQDQQRFRTIEGRRAAGVRTNMVPVNIGQMRQETMLKAIGSHAMVEAINERYRDVRDNELREAGRRGRPADEVPNDVPGTLIEQAVARQSVDAEGDDTAEVRS
jgi:hypothetical protein